MACCAFHLEATTLTPFVPGACVHLDTDGFSEQGGDSALEVQGQSQAIGASLVGLRLGSVLNATRAATVRARGLIGWRHVYGDTAPEARMAGRPSSSKACRWRVMRWRSKPGYWDSRGIFTARIRGTSSHG